MKYFIGFFISMATVSLTYFFYLEFLNRTPQSGNVTPVEEIQEEEILVPKEDPTITLLFFGDAMFDRGVRTQKDVAGLFVGVQSMIDESDFTILNLEGTITPFTSVAAYANLNFTFPTTTALVLRSVGVDGVSLANNHTGDFGRKGLEYTRQYLDEAGIFHFGDEYNSSSTRSYVLRSGNNEIAFVGYHEFVNPVLTPFLEEIQMHKNAGRIVIFMPHWGTEYKKQANTSQIYIAQKAVEAGADIVIGAHPHVVQNAEMIQRSPVFYSLGNFIFDQFFSYDVKEELAVRVTIDLSSRVVTMLELIPLWRERYISAIIENRESWCVDYTKNSSLISGFFTEPGNGCMLYRVYE